jgi:hypothetical protein
MGAGIPQKAVEGFFEIAVPSIFPKPQEKSILLFDELNRGLSHAIAMFFTMLEDGRMFNYKLPEHCLVVGAMNPSSKDYNVTEIENEAAIRRRIKLLYVVSEFSGWNAHAKTDMFHLTTEGPAKDKPCHPMIHAYFQANPKLLYDTRAKSQGKQYVCPATVETISADAYLLEQEGIPLFGDIAQVRYGASIGVTGTAQLVEYIKDSTVVLGASDILEGYSKRAQRAVKKLIKNGQHEKLADLCENVLSLLFAEQPDVRKTSPHFVNFCRDLPEELAGNMVFQMKETATQSNARPYLDALMDELQDYDDWINFQIKIDDNHRKVDEGVRS